MKISTLAPTPTSSVALLVAALMLLPPGAGAAPHTPQPGSPERQAICDAMRVYVARHASRKLPMPIVFKVEFMRVDGDYAGFEGYPIFKDGSPAIGTYLPDIVTTVILLRSPAGWRVIADLSRTDVPSADELAGIRGTLPADLPGGVLPDFWRKMLKR